MSAIDVSVTVKGKLFTKKIDQTMRMAIVDEALVKIDERLTRKGTQGSGGKGLGVTRNTVSKRLLRESLELEVESTRNWPRTKGTSWTRKNIGIVKGMAPRVMRKTANRMVQELGG